MEKIEKVKAGMIVCKVLIDNIVKITTAAKRNAYIVSITSPNLKSCLGVVSI